MTPFDFSPAAIAALAQSDAARALQEDVGSGDLTAALVDPAAQARARVLLRERAILCGQAWASAALHALAPQARLDWKLAEGAWGQPNQVVVELHGPAQALLSAERTMLNFLQMMSGVATHCAHFVAAVQSVPGNRAQIVDTRKTLPGLRLAQKYAVRTGGGTNHRIGLFDAVLIKENHIAAAGGVSAALLRAQAVAAQAQFVEIEVETLEQLREALQAGARMVLLDNMTHAQLTEAVAINAGRAVLEVSGGVTMDSVGAIAATGVDRISIGALTKDIRATDFSMRLEQI